MTDILRYFGIFDGYFRQVGVRGDAQSVAVLEDHVPNPRGLGQEDGQPLRRDSGGLGHPLPKGEVRVPTLSPRTHAFRTSMSS